MTVVSGLTAEKMLQLVDDVLKARFPKPNLEPNSDLNTKMDPGVHKIQASVIPTVTNGPLSRQTISPAIFVVLDSTSDIVDPGCAHLYIVLGDSPEFWWRTTNSSGTVWGPWNQINPGLDTLYRIENLPDSNNMAFAVLDQDNRRTEIEIGVDGKFTQRVVDSLKQRINEGQVYKAYEWNLRWTRMLTRRLLSKNLSPNTRFRISMIGDSYTFAPTRWTRVFQEAMVRQYGDAGVGYVSFSNADGSGIAASVRSDVTVVETGSWTKLPTYQSTHGPDLGHITSAITGDSVVVNFPTGQNSAKLFYLGSSDGVISYSWDVGVWGNLTLSGSGLQTIDLTPPTGASRLSVKVSSGSVSLCGVDLLKPVTADGGVVLDKLGSTGSKAEQWAAVDKASWGRGITALSPDLVIVMLGTNDQATRTASQFEENLTTIVNNIYAARGGRGSVDVLLAMPAENQRGLLNTMASYSAAAQRVAKSLQCGFLDTQLLFGENPSDYSATSNRKWYSSDNVHPDPNTGGRVIADAIFRFVNYS